MKDETFTRAADFIWKNARLIDRHLFAYLFCDGSPEPVVATLKGYQNPDGGFGHALEPDNRCPSSQPIFVETALYILDMVGQLSNPRVQAEMLLPACDYLSSETTPEGGVPFVLPSVNAYPHTPWMGAPDNPPAALNPTASLAGLLLKSGIQHPWIERASAFCWQEIAASESEGYHDIMPMLTFLQYAPEQARAAVELERITQRVRKPGVVEMDPGAGGYVKMPIDWAPLPTSFFRKLFDDDTLRLHLGALINKQQSDGGWATTWDAVSKASEYEWRGRMTIDALVTLRAYEKAGLVI